MTPRRVPPAASTPVAEAELSVLKVLWDGGPGVVRDVQERLAGQDRDYAYTTVQTLLQRLCEKGLVRKDDRGHAHVYSAVISREQHASARVHDVVDSVLDGAMAPLLLGLMPRGRFTKDEIEQFRALLDAAEAKAGKRRSSGRKADSGKGDGPKGGNG